MAQIGELSVLVSASTTLFQKSMKKASSTARRFATTVERRLGKSIKGLTRGLMSTTAALIGFGTATAALGRGVQLASQMETTALQFEILTKSATKGKKVLQDIKSFAAKTPFAFPDLAASGKRLLAFGVSSDLIIDRLKVLGDIAAASGANINELAGIFGKMKSSGVVALGDLNQLGDRGIPIMEQLKTQLSLTGSELRKFVSGGNLQFADVLKAMQAITGEGGTMQGALARLSSTTAGKFSTLKDNINDALTDIGKSFLEAFDVKTVIADLTTIAKYAKEDLAPALANAFAAVANFGKEVSKPGGIEVQLFEGKKARELRRNFGGIADRDRLKEELGVPSARRSFADPIQRKGAGVFQGGFFQAKESLKQQRVGEITKLGKFIGKGILDFGTSSAGITTSTGDIGTGLSDAKLNTAFGNMAQQQGLMLADKLGQLIGGGSNLLGGAANAIGGALPFGKGGGGGGGVFGAATAITQGSSEAMRLQSQQQQAAKIETIQQQQLNQTQQQTGILVAIREALTSPSQFNSGGVFP